MSLQNNCDRVKIACLAQLVNVIAPIMTEKDGKAWRQTIFYPYLFASNLGLGNALKVNVQGSSYKSREGWDVPYLYSSVIDNEERGELIVFALNRSLFEDIELEAHLEGFSGYSLSRHVELYSDNLNAQNSKDEEVIKPTEQEIGNDKAVILKKHSWNMLVYKK